MARLTSFALTLLLTTGTPAVAGKLFIIGDSVSTSVHAGWTAGQGWGALVAAAAGMTEVNLAVSGATDAQMGAQVTTALAQYASGDAIEIMPFENDISVTPPAVAKATLDGQVRDAIAAGVPANRITLHTPFIIQGIAYQRAAPLYLAAIREIALNRGTGLVDVYAHFSELVQTGVGISQFYVSGDPQHPGPLGHAEIARLYSFPQNANLAAFHTPGASLVIGAPSIVTTPLHQVVEVGPTLLSAQVSYIDPGNAPATHWNVQDYNAPGGEVALQLDGADFPCSGSVTVTPDVFARLMIKPVAHPHDIWVSTTNGTYASTGIDFAVTPP